MLILHDRGKHNKILKNVLRSELGLLSFIGEDEELLDKIFRPTNSNTVNSLRMCRKTSIKVKVLASEWTCYITEQKLKKKLLQESDKALLIKYELLPFDEAELFYRIIMIFGMVSMANREMCQDSYHPPTSTCFYYYTRKKMIPLRKRSRMCVL